MVNNLIEFKEFQGFKEIIEKKIENELAFKELLKIHNSKDNGMTLKGFKDWWRQSILRESEAVVWDWLFKLGYDRQLYSVRSRLFTLTVQSRSLEEDKPVELRIRDAINTDIDNKTNQMIID